MRLYKNENPFSRYALLTCAFVFILIKIVQINSSPDYFRSSAAIAYDTYGYYLHLPAVIIHKDPGIENKIWLDSLNSNYQKDRPWYQAWPGEKGRMVNVYTVGIAIMWSPFFLCGHFIAGLSDYPQDGLSPPYQIMIVIAGLFYAILGMLLLRRLLLKFVPDKIAALVLVLIGFGTNLFHYATYDNTMPHILLFAFDTLIILLTISWHEKPEKRTAFFLGLTLALVTISRPSEIVWVLVPVFWGVSNWRTFIEKIRFFRTHLSHIFCLGTGLLLIGLLQPLYWKYTSGHWFYNNHVEGFDFFHPFTWKVLFSYKKGWLLYTPMMILAIGGFIVLFKTHRKLFVPVFIFFLANLWFISSWECWWYAGSFGQRPFVQSYGIMAIPLAFFIEWIKLNKLLKWIGGVLIMFFVFLNLFQVWQLVHGIIHPVFMTEKYYWKVFLKTEFDPLAIRYLEIDRENLPPVNNADYNAREVVSIDYENPNLLRPDQLICDTFGNQSLHSEILDQDHSYGTVFKSPFESVCSKDYLRIKMECDVFIPVESFENELSLVCNMTGSRGQTYGYTAFSAQQLGAKPGEWSHINAWFVTPPILHKGDIVTILPWNNGGGKVFIDNIRIILYEPEDLP
ncbi:hypothetical protein BH11BAC7_BH11BAC7_00200 [soil metagenome]